MSDPTGETDRIPRRPCFNRRLELEAAIDTPGLSASGLFGLSPGAICHSFVWIRVRLPFGRRLCYMSSRSESCSTDWEDTGLAKR
jgi:hypothetical protein